MVQLDAVLPKMATFLVTSAYQQEAGMYSSVDGLLTVNLRGK